MNMLKTVMIVFFAFFLILLACAQGDNKSATQYKYWGNGKIREIKYYNPQGDLLCERYYRDTGTLEQTIAYDIEGHIIEESYYDENGKLCQNPVDNWAAKVSKYTEGTLAEECYYNDDGVITERDIYSASGDIVDKQFVGDSRIDSAAENFKPSLVQFDGPIEERNSRMKVGVETDEYYDSKGELQDAVTTVDE